MILFRSHYDVSHVCSGCNVTVQRPRQHFSQDAIGVLPSVPFCDIKYSPYLIIAGQIGNSFPKWLGLLPIPGACLGPVAGSCRDGLIMVVQATEPFLMSASVYKSSPLAHATRYPSRNAPLRFLLLLSSPAHPQRNKQLEARCAHR